MLAIDVGRGQHLGDGFRIGLPVRLVEALEFQQQDHASLLLARTQTAQRPGSDTYGCVMGSDIRLRQEAEKWTKQHRARGMRRLACPSTARLFFRRKNRQVANICPAGELDNIS
jgi:hypothetical protein